MEIYGEKVEPTMASFADLIEEAIDDLWGCMDGSEESPSSE